MVIKKGFQNVQSTRRSPPKSEPVRAGSGNPAVTQTGNPAVSSRQVVALAVSKAGVPKVQPPVKPSADPRMPLATSVAKQVSEVLGLPPGQKAKALSLAVTEAVIKAVPKYMPLAKVASMVAKVQGPPPRVVHTLVPVGTLGAVAASMPPVSQEVMVNALVTSLVLLRRSGAGARGMRGADCSGK